MGNMAVTGIGTASVTHHTTIQVAIEITRQAVSSRGVGLGTNSSKRNTNGPCYEANDLGVIGLNVGGFQILEWLGSLQFYQFAGALKVFRINFYNVQSLRQFADIDSVRTSVSVKL